MGMDSPLKPTTNSISSATTTVRPFTNTSRPTVSPQILPQPQTHHHLHYSPQPQPLFTPQQALPIRPTPNDPPPPQQHHFSKPLLQPDLLSRPILYPLSSSGRGFIPSHRPVRPDHTVTVATTSPSSGFPPARHVVSFPPGIRSVGSPRLDVLAHTGNMMSPPILQQPQNLNVSSVGLAPNNPKISKVAHPTSISESNGYKEKRDRTRDDSLVVVRDRKVRITDGVSLYSLCRSWLRNGFPDECQIQQGNSLKSLPKPLPIALARSNLSGKEDGEDEEEDEKTIEHLSSKDLLKRHVKRAKKVRAKLREERLQRIARYKTRLALLLPLQVEQFRKRSSCRKLS